MLEPPASPEPHHAPPPSPNWWVNPCRVALLAPAFPNARGDRADREPPPDKVDQGCPHAVATPWNWLGNRFVATAARPAADVRVLPPVQELLGVQECPLECANRWLPVSSCSCRSRSADRRHRPPAVPTHQPKPVQGQPHPQWHVQLLHRHPVVRASVLAVLVASDVPVGRIGMTAPSWKPCAAARRRSSARRSTSSEKTMIR